MSYSSTITATDLAEQQRRKDECINSALAEGAKSAALALAVSGGLSQALKYFSEAYRFKFTTGPRTAVVIMPVFTAFWFVSERQVMKCGANRANRWKSLDTLNGYKGH